MPYNSAHNYTSWESVTVWFSFTWLMSGFIFEASHTSVILFLYSLYTSTVSISFSDLSKWICVNRSRTRNWKMLPLCTYLFFGVYVRGNLCIYSFSNCKGRDILDSENEWKAALLTAPYHFFLWIRPQAYRLSEVRMSFLFHWILTPKPSTKFCSMEVLCWTCNSTSWFQKIRKPTSPIWEILIFQLDDSDENLNTVARRKKKEMIRVLWAISCLQVRHQLEQWAGWDVEESRCTCI